MANREQMRIAIDRLAEHVREVYLHIDMDSLDLEFAPGCRRCSRTRWDFLAGFGGNYLCCVAHLRVKAATLAVYDPDHDQDDKTLRTAVRLIEIVAEGAKAQA